MNIPPVRTYRNVKRYKIISIITAANIALKVRFFIFSCDCSLIAHSPINQIITKDDVQKRHLRLDLFCLLRLPQSMPAKMLLLSSMLFADFLLLSYIRKSPKSEYLPYRNTPPPIFRVLTSKKLSSFAEYPIFQFFSLAYSRNNDRFRPKLRKLLCIVSDFFQVLTFRLKNLLFFQAGTKPL